MPANRLSVACRATWRRRELADERGDKLALFPGAGGEPGWLWRRRPWQRRAADTGVPPKALSAALLAARAAWRVAVRRLVRGVALQSGPKPGGQRVGSGAVRAIRALWARPVHARKVFDTMPWHATGHR